METNNNDTHKQILQLMKEKLEAKKSKYYDKRINQLAKLLKREDNEEKTDIIEAKIFEMLGVCK